MEGYIPISNSVLEMLYTVMCIGNGVLYILMSIKSYGVLKANRIHGIKLLQTNRKYRNTLFVCLAVCLFKLCPGNSLSVTLDWILLFMSQVLYDSFVPRQIIHNDWNIYVYYKHTCCQ